MRCNTLLSWLVRGWHVATLLTSDQRVTGQPPDTDRAEGGLGFNGHLLMQAETH